MDRLAVPQIAFRRRGVPSRRRPRCPEPYSRCPDVLQGNEDVVRRLRALSRRARTTAASARARPSFAAPFAPSPLPARRARAPVRTACPSTAKGSARFATGTFEHYGPALPPPARPWRPVTNLPPGSSLSDGNKPTPLHPRDRAFLAVLADEREMPFVVPAGQEAAAIHPHLLGDARRSPRGGTAALSSMPRVTPTDPARSPLPPPNLQ